ncbi:peptidase [Gardnerella pickettii]|uniref:peptidase n=1 Tax=Gardnerella pickettii TaxID=2914924 RepID=UPI0039EF7F07
MMNKKAIAAFAAGATLLAGFAMATPAMAANNDDTPFKNQGEVSSFFNELLIPQKKAAKTYTKAQVLRLEVAVEEAKATVEEKTKAANDAQTATYDNDTDGAKKKAAVEAAQKALSAAQKSLETAQKALNEAKPAPAEADPKNPQDTKPAETSKDAKAKQGQSGQAGANGAAAGAKTTVVEKKKDAGKKLPATGVGVTLTALAATMLAGMGAAVRKARH